MIQDIKRFKGIFVAFYGCFHEDGTIAPEKAAKLASWYAEKGVNGLYLNGSSGEGMLLDVEERKRLTDAVMNSVRFYFNGAVFRHLQVMDSCKYGGTDSDKRIVRIGTATCKQDRFASVCASFNGGKLESVPLTLVGQTLHFNSGSIWRNDRENQRK